MRSYLRGSIAYLAVENIGTTSIRVPRNNLFGVTAKELERKRGSDKIAEAYRERLKSTFTKVAPTRRVLKNSTNSNLFDLFFAASNPRGASIAVKIADHILKHW